MGKFDEALADCNAVLNRYPKAIYTLTSRANAYLAKGDLDKALADYNQVIQINPNYVRAYVGRGPLFEKRRDAGAARFRRRQRRARQGRRHRNHAGTPLCQGAARGAAGRVEPAERGKPSTPPRRVRARWR